MNKPLSIITATLLPVASSAQIQFGVKCGLNVSRESDRIFHVVNAGTFSLATDFRPGFSIGGLVNIPAGSVSDIEADISYSMLGCRDRTFDVETMTDEPFGTLTCHYLTIPVMEKYCLFDSGLYLEVGPQFGFLLAKRERVEGIGSYTPFEGSNNIFDFALLGGIGYRFSDTYFVDARYVYSLTETCEVYEGGKLRNIQLSLGYLF